MYFFKRRVLGLATVKETLTDFCLFKTIRKDKFIKNSDKLKKNTIYLKNYISVIRTDSSNQ